MGARTMFNFPRDNAVRVSEGVPKEGRFYMHTLELLDAIRFWAKACPSVPIKFVLCGHG